MNTREDCLALLAASHSPHTELPALEKRLLALFRDAPQEKAPGDDKVFAIHMQVILKSGYATAGVLTVEDDGMLHMFQPGLAQNPVARSAPPLEIVAHHYFSARDIEALVLVDMPKAKAAASTLYTG